MTRVLIYSVLVLGFVLSIAERSSATPITWTLDSVVFDDGGTATGAFVYDADLFVFSGINITTTAGTDLSYGDVYGVPGGLGSAFFFDTLSSSPVIVGTTSRLYFIPASQMTNSGGTFAISQGSEFPCPDAACNVGLEFRNIASGRITAEQNAPVPEPTSLLLIATGATGLAWRIRWRRSRTP